MVLKGRFLGVALVTLLAGSGAFAQDAAGGANAPRVVNFDDRDGLVASFVQAPVLGSTSGSGNDSAGQWLKIEFHFKVNPPATQKSPYVDAAEFKVWVEGRDLYAANAPGADGVAVALTGSVTYVNLPAGRDLYGVFYVHPSALTRYSTKNGAQEDFDRRFNIHIEADVAGTPVDVYDKKKETDAGWYKPLVPVAGMVMRQDMTPFIAADVSRYPQIKVPAAATGQ
jgi:hypothetical protein